MNILKRIFVLTLVALAMVACNKDQEFAAGTQNKTITKTETTIFETNTAR